MKNQDRKKGSRWNLGFLSNSPLPNSPFRIQNSENYGTQETRFGTSSAFWLPNSLFSFLNSLFEIQYSLFIPWQYRYGSAVGERWGSQFALDLRFVFCVLGVFRYSRCTVTKWTDG